MKIEDVLAMLEADQYQVRSGYSLREIAGEYLAIPVALQECADSMSLGGKFLWEQLQTPKTLSDLEAAMTANFEVDAARARTDILEFLQYLKQYDLLEN